MKSLNHNTQILHSGLESMYVVIMDTDKEAKGVSFAFTNVFHYDCKVTKLAMKVHVLLNLLPILILQILLTRLQHPPCT